MRIEFDPDKDKSLQAKHGVSLALAGTLDRDAALVWIADRFGCEEMRMIALTPESSTLYYLAFVDRGDARRIISLRRATQSSKLRPLSC